MKNRCIDCVVLVTTNGWLLRVLLWPRNSSAACQLHGPFVSQVVGYCDVDTLPNSRLTSRPIKCHASVSGHPIEAYDTIQMIAKSSGTGKTTKRGIDFYHGQNSKLAFSVRLSLLSSSLQDCFKASPVRFLATTNSFLDMLTSRFPMVM